MLEIAHVDDVSIPEQQLIDDWISGWRRRIIQANGRKAPPGKQ